MTWQPPETSSPSRWIILIALSGIDISGVDPPGVRTLQGDGLAECIEAILDSPMGLAIHVGELESEKELRDNPAALMAIDRWLLRHPLLTCRGKIRLGHAIFLSEEHIHLIRKHQLPIEICPTYHQYLWCWRNGQKHPVQTLYPEQTAPVLLGTDNTLNFSTDFQREKELFVGSFAYNPANGWNYRFGQFFDASKGTMTDSAEAIG